MCKFQASCGSKETRNCKYCKGTLCKQCDRSYKTGNKPPNTNVCPDCGKCPK